LSVYANACFQLATTKAVKANRSLDINFTHDTISKV